VPDASQYGSWNCEFPPPWDSDPRCGSACMRVVPE
jgi:hypothetical protein